MQERHKVEWNGYTEISRYSRQHVLLIKAFVSLQKAGSHEDNWRTMDGNIIKTNESLRSYSFLYVFKRFIYVFMYACNYHAVMETETRAPNMGSMCSIIKLGPYFHFCLSIFHKADDVLLKDSEG